MRFVRVVLDTNILIGALITRDTPPDVLYRAWLRGAFEVVTSRAQLVELATVLARPRLQRYIDPEEAAVIVEHLETRATVLLDVPPVFLSTDSADNEILAAAIAGEADLIVSGDRRHVLALGHAEGIPVVTARDAMERFEEP
jgi:hypothetical protein